MLMKSEADLTGACPVECGAYSSAVCPWLKKVKKSLHQTSKLLKVVLKPTLLK